MEIKKRTENAIMARIKSTARKYGTDATRLVLQRWAMKEREQLKIEQEIEYQREKLVELQKKKNVKL